MLLHPYLFPYISIFFLCLFSCGNRTFDFSVDSGPFSTATKTRTCFRRQNRSFRQRGSWAQVSTSNEQSMNHKVLRMKCSRKISCRSNDMGEASATGEMNGTKEMHERNKGNEVNENNES